MSLPAAIKCLARKSKEFNREDKICNELFHNQFSSIPDNTGPSSNIGTTHNSEIVPDSLDEQSDLSTFSANILRTKNYTSRKNTNSEKIFSNSPSEKQKPSSECMTYDRLNFFIGVNQKSTSENKEFFTSKIKHHNSEVLLLDSSQTVSQQYKPPQTSSLLLKENPNLSLKAINRILKEFQKLLKHPIDNIQINFREKLITEWHFLFTGLKSTHFQGGKYHGLLEFPENYPFSPPSIRFFTPNGRFKTDERVPFALIHSECWKPSYTVSAVLEGVYSFMMTETTDTVGSLERNENEIRSLAIKSEYFNRKDQICTEMFRNQFTPNVNSTSLSSNIETRYISDIVPKYSDEQINYSKTSPNKFKAKIYTSRAYKETKMITTNPLIERQKASSEYIPYHISDSRPANSKSLSEFGEIPSSQINHKDYEIKIQRIPQSISEQHEPSETCSFLNNDNSNLSMKKRRLLKEFVEISKDPIDNIIVKYRQNLNFEWHFKFIGLKETPFEGGEYHGVLEFPDNYPSSPLPIRFITPNERFQTNERICFDLIDFHSSIECWKPAYTVSSVLQRAYDSMMSETTETVESLEIDRNKIWKLARRSKEFNITNPIFFELFQCTVYTECVSLPNSRENTYSKKLLIKDSVFFNDSGTSNIEIKSEYRNFVPSITIL